ncbi:MAG: thiosulfate oxidation carrier protein SoxY [Hydrogenophaga sp.]|jgi:sulfur-oxidizing protein SoxY|uniref:thiosulfate oxidation carrier protein SoxY n=1 Tax=Hydrogenophaga sp. TaxID=1904254 RepID=UPI0025C0621B|nr:thiosulfate oxidation carrier protein SoxY [Hydrogenophaga sp.]MDO9135894.1 thiosulfate oxidation carrier protein SoxY [Hydrogenophaga sp.]MDO9505165.1 thiosulfate oxidation carrier protein SoxY [Hydrogenophaga sp.]MDP2075068.1 thiosulfate oxidation carrier protein SoxY [Hydrogenophaga sp.]MDP3109741.1 thiosulfate oxidation carrier protein SoxY [Hydrogenophaga sp.]MDP3205854.1 thiosulfate oxidation carrier protein SoxY [Hydrogenophaga sp.]
MNNSRRVALKTTGAFATLVSLGLISQSQAHAAMDRAGFDVKSMADAVKALGGTAANSDQITVVAPDIAENGAVVPVGAVSKLPNTTEIYLIVEKNPTPMAAGFKIPAGTAADVQTRLKMGQSSNVFAVVKADGKLFSAFKETKVTLGGCGG